MRHVRLTEREVQGLSGEVPDDVGSVTTPKGEETLVTVGAAETVGDAFVGGSQTTLLDLYCHVTISLSSQRMCRADTDHLVLVLHQELDTLNGSSRRFGNGLDMTTTSAHDSTTLASQPLTAETPPIMKSTE